MENKLESRHNIGQSVVLNLFDAGRITNAQVAAIKFTDYGKVLYDIKVFPWLNEKGIVGGIEYDNTTHYQLFTDVDSYFIDSEWDESLNK